jgi:hypothetical protein
MVRTLISMARYTPAVEAQVPIGRHKTGQGIGEQDHGRQHAQPVRIWEGL